MVKNTSGGSKHKGLARKDVNSSFSSDYVPRNPAERYAKVTKLLGNGMCYVSLFDNDLSSISHDSLICHIRGVFKSKNKRQNTISIDSFVVVGLRDWESSQHKCDLIAILHSPLPLLHSELPFESLFINNHSYITPHSLSIAPSDHIDLSDI